MGKTVCEDSQSESNSESYEELPLGPGDVQPRKEHAKKDKAKCKKSIKIRGSHAKDKFYDNK